MLPSLLGASPSQTTVLVFGTIPSSNRRFAPDGNGDCDGDTTMPTAITEIFIIGIGS
jgi:hypothetical protein